MTTPVAPPSTSPSFAVNPKKQQALLARMAELGVAESDLEEQFIRSSGPGGQHLNKTSSAVRVRHIPTGLEARCGKERSQSVNRFIARRELMEKIAKSRGLSTRLDDQQERIRKQKKRRNRRQNSKNLLNNSND